MKLSDVTIERNFPSGSLTAWWSDDSGYLCHETFYFYTRAEIRAYLRERFAQ